jgi:hypothetical protein
MEPEADDSTDSTSDLPSDVKAKAEDSHSRSVDGSSGHSGLQIRTDSAAAAAVVRESPAKGSHDAAEGDDDEPAVAV